MQTNPDKVVEYERSLKALLKDPFNFQMWDTALRIKDFALFLGEYQEHNKNADTVYHLLGKVAKKEIWNHAQVAKIAETLQRFNVVFHYAHLNKKGLDAETAAYKEGNFLLGRMLNEIGKKAAAKEQQEITIEEPPMLPPPESEIQLDWAKAANPNAISREELAEVEWNEKISAKYGREFAYNNWLHV